MATVTVQFSVQVMRKGHTIPAGVPIEVDEQELPMLTKAGAVILVDSVPQPATPVEEALPVVEDVVHEEKQPAEKPEEEQSAKKSKVTLSDAAKPKKTGK